jgi:hypothetical protein
MSRVVVAAAVWAVLAGCAGGSGAEADADAVGDAVADGAGDVGGEVVGPDAAPDVVTLQDADALDDGADATADPGADPGGDDGGDDADGGGGGAFGAPCEDNTTCFSGFCVEGPSGRQCTKLCDAACPEGWGCKAVGGAGDVTFICVYDHVTYCAPCEIKADCDHPLTPGADNRCVDFGDGAGSFCATECAGGGCPAGASCVALPDEKTVCLPDDDACECTDYAVRVEAATVCARSSAFGQCFGTRGCGPGGLSACDAAVAAQELCDGLDQDCDAATDEGFAGLGAPCDGDDSDQCAEGTLGCSAAGDGVSCGDLTADAVERCDAVDEDCDGATDEDFGVGAACVGVGACGAGVWECAGLAAARCSTDPGGSADGAQPELCDGVDDDCDGATDEDFGVGAACEGVGACGAGARECAGVGASRCSTDPGGSEDGAASEACDGADQDCDGATDEDFEVGAVCDGVGKCGAGTLECAGVGEAQCSTDPGGSQAQGDEELCNAADDDCDGSTDEAFAVGQACEGEGECGAGVLECAGLLGARCSTGVGGTADQAAAERCDGLDDDCDGASDEDFGVGAACDGVGACGAGVLECAGVAAATCSTNPGASGDGASDESCDGVDDDCDGATDEDFGVGTACEGVGACGPGVVECASAQTTRCSTDVGSSDDGSGVELCNAVDDDCDGVTDDGFGLGAECQGGGACGKGVVECATLGTTRCSTGPGGSQEGAGDEVCDGVDNDCNGATDEGFGVGQVCDGVGACGLGTVECAGASVTRCSTDAGGSADASGAQACSGADDDCDGATDEGFGVGQACEGEGECGAGQIECFGEAVTGCSSDPGGSAGQSVVERCSGVDDDCDGATDEGFGVGAACEGAGECGAGVVECAGEQATRCSTEAGGADDESQPEVCDGKDEDCSGLADDGGAGCPCEVQHVGGTAYLFCTAALAWTAARDACAAAGYELATIESKAENDALVGIALPKKASPWWIGLNDRDNEGVHVWVSGSAATYRNWAGGEPNEFQHGEKCGVSSTGEDCVQFSPATAGAPPEWNDEPCSCPYPYVCRQAGAP